MSAQPHRTDVGRRWQLYGREMDAARVRLATEALSFVTAIAHGLSPEEARHRFLDNPLESHTAPLAPPTLDAYRTEDGTQLAVWCTHEGRWHRHGSGCRGCPTRYRTTEAGQRVRTLGGHCTCPPGSGDGHRAAHCSCRRGLYGSGYVLREVGPLTDEVIAAHGRELSYTRGCRFDSCRFDRLVRRQVDRAVRRQQAAAYRDAIDSTGLRVLAEAVDRVLERGDQGLNGDSSPLATAMGNLRREIAGGSVDRARASDALQMAAQGSGWPAADLPVLIAAISYGT